jgi:Protein of unknown function (DUF2855)
MSEFTEVQVNKRDVTTHRGVTRAVPELADGQVLFAVDRFAITANNVTYGVYGDAMKYWNFFPAGGAGGADAAEWGVIPVWGFGDVVESRCDGVEVGSRHYGYFPMASHVVVEPAKVSGSSMFDGVEHRRELHSVYNQYVRTSTDPSYRVEREAEQMLLRPLFTTSFLIDDFLADNNMFGAQTIVLSSASSKTAYGAAFNLFNRGSVRVMGLTSQRNRAFTDALGCYDGVLTYDQINELDDELTAYVDLSGSAATRLAMHTHFGDSLTYSCIVGGTDWTAAPATEALPGPSPQMFFAPSQVAKRNKDWGPIEFQNRLGTAWTAFLDAMVNGDEPWMTVEHVTGPEAVAACFTGHAKGTMSPHIGHIAQV